MGYTHEWTVRFGEVDRAGIIYYPNLFDALHRGVEDLLGEAGFPFHELVFEAGVGMPIVHAEADYHRPIRYGSVVGVDIEPSIGDSSVTFAAEGYVDGEHVFTAVEKHATIDIDAFEPMPVPADLDVALAPYTS